MTLLAAGLLLAFAVLTALVAAHFGPLVHLDGRVMRHLDRVTAEHHGWRRFWVDVSAVLSPTVLRVLAAVLVVVAAVRGRPRPAAALAVTMIVAALLSTVLKALVDRPRPRPPVVLATAAGASFPSGHALTAAAFFTGVVGVAATFGPVRRPLATVMGTVAAVLVLTVSVSRLLLAVHFVSDVVGGLLVGAAPALLAVRWAARSPRITRQRLAFRGRLR